MSLALTAWLAAAMLSLGPHGTLVVMIPTRDGLVVAADSRSTVNSLTCDEVYKIVVVPRRERTVLAVTGTGVFLPIRKEQPTDLCRFIREEKPLLDIETLAQEFLSKGRGDLAPGEVYSLGSACVSATREFQAKYRRLQPLARAAGKAIYTVVIGMYNPSQRAATITYFKVIIGPEDLLPRLDAPQQVRVFESDVLATYSFGETDYVAKHVGAVADRYLGDYISLLNKRKIVGDVSVAEARRAAFSLIYASSRATEIIPSESGIGGPIDIVLLGTPPRPLKLDWKNIPSSGSPLLHTLPFTRVMWGVVLVGGFVLLSAARRSKKQRPK
jgi:hypothetical protein